MNPWQSLELGVLANLEQSKQYEGGFQAIKLSLPLTWNLGYFGTDVGIGFNLGVAYDYIFNAKLENIELKTNEFNPHDIGFIWGIKFVIGKVGFNFSNKYGFLDRHNKDVKITYKEQIFGLTFYF